MDTDQYRGRVITASSAASLDTQGVSGRPHQDVTCQRTSRISSFRAQSWRSHRLRMPLHPKAFSTSTKAIGRCELPKLTWLAKNACSKTCRPPTMVVAYFQPRARRNRNSLLLRVGSYDRPEQP